jgi:Putative phage metallopeptidase
MAEPGIDSMPMVQARSLVIRRKVMAQDTRIDPAPEVQQIAEGLITKYHPELRECGLGYYFTTGATRCHPVKCNTVLRYFASTHLGAPRAAVDEGPDYLLLVTYEDWEFLVPGQQEPFIDHRLEHLSRETTKDGGVRFVLKPHSIEEHDAVVQRFGRYSFAVKRFGQIIQPELDLVVTERTPSDENLPRLQLAESLPTGHREGLTRARL